MKKLLFISIFIFFQQLIVSQDFKELKRIYESLELDTEAKDNLKQKWIINDYLFVKEVYSRFKARNAFRINGNRVLNMDLIKSRLYQIEDGRIIIDVRRRYYDEEIEYFAFISSVTLKPLFDPIIDGFYLKEILGDKLYSRIKSKEYAFIDMSVKKFYTLEGFFYDINLNLLNPELMFWSSTSDNRNLPESKEELLNQEIDTTGIFSDTTSFYSENDTTMLNDVSPEMTTETVQPNKKLVAEDDLAFYIGKNKYLVSIFGKWGNEYINVPGWYYSDYIGGLRVTYYSEIDPRKSLNHYAYSVYVGTSYPSVRPIKQEKETIRPLFNSGKNVYFKISGDPLKYIFNNFKDSEFFLEGLFSVSSRNKNGYGINYAIDFYSIRNYFVFGGKKRNIFSLGDFGQFEAGLGIATHDIHYYQIIPDTNKIWDLESEKGPMDRFNHFVYAEFGFTRSGGLIQHSLSGMISHNVQFGFGYVGLKARIMIYETFGLEVIVQTAYGGSKEHPFPHWREDSYFVLSPIFRINY